MCTAHTSGAQGARATCLCRAQRGISAADLGAEADRVAHVHREMGPVVRQHKDLAHLAPQPVSNVEEKTPTEESANEQLEA